MPIVKYSILIRNKRLKCAKWYGRIRQDGREKFIPMESRGEAERWLNEQNYRFGEYRAGNLGEDEILTIASTPVKARKRASEAVLTIRECLDRWEASGRLEGKRETTLASYGRALRLMLDGELPLTALTQEYIRSVLDSRAGLKSTTRRFYAKALLSLAKFVGREYGVRGLEDAIPSIRADEGARVFWTPADMEEIILEIRCKDAVKTLQYREFYTLMKEVGSRQGETGLITWSDVYSDGKGGGVVRFRGSTTKSRRERCVPISLELWASLEARRGLPGKLVFDAIPRSQSARYDVLKNALDRLGLPGNQHTFRHSVAMAMYAKSKDIKACAQLLGHGETTAMKYYLAARSLEELRELVEEP